MTDIHIRLRGRAGRITLNRPKALNALTHQMCLDIDQALKEWETADIDLLLIDAAGDKAFCSGGDIAEMYSTGCAGDFAYGQGFWRDEYRMNERLFNFPKPVVTFLQGYTMGGGVGVGCHGSHRIVCDGSQIAMPECSIGLVPDVGGSLLLARAPGRMGEYLGSTGTRMGPGDAIYAGFADYFVDQDKWETLKSTLIDTGDVYAVDHAATAAPDGALKDLQGWVDTYFAGETFGDIYRGLPQEDRPKAFAHNAPLAMAVATAIVRRARGTGNIRSALEQEYRYTHRAMAQGDFIEGIRAAIIDKDRTPEWAHASPLDVKESDVYNMTKTLGPDALDWEEKP